MPMRIQEWLKEAVENQRYRKLIWWFDEKERRIAIHWKHASYEDYNEQDSALFKKWAKDNNRYDPEANDSPDERKRWKTNFRCALHSATNIRKEQTEAMTSNEKQPYRIYELLEKPDPIKVMQKKKSNQLAAKSKMKPRSEKRPYKSRLNKSQLQIKEEPSSSELYSKKPRLHGKRCGHIKEEMPTDKAFDAKPASSYSGHWYNKPHPQDDTSMEHLPATLEMFNEEDEREDGGYCSASDSSSVKSLDSGVNSLPTSNECSIDDISIQLEPVETILRKHCYTVGPLPSPVHDTDSYNDCAINNNVYYMHDDQVYDVSSTAGVRTQVLAEHEVIVPFSIQDSQDIYDMPYSLTAL